MKRYAKRLLCFLLFAAMGLAACGDGGIRSADAAVLKIDGEEITKTEYLVYLYTATQSFLSAVGEDVWNMDFDGETADELLEDRTISTLQSVIAAKAYAAENGILLTDAQKQEAEEAAGQFISGVAPEDLEKIGVDAKSLVPLMEASYLYSLVCETIAAECEVDSEEVERFCEENYEQARAGYTMLQLDSILLDDAEQAEKAAERARAGEDFEALFQEYDVDDAAKGNANGGHMTMDQSYLQSVTGDSADWETGNIVGPLLLNGRYYIFKVLERIEPTDTEVRELMEEAYRNQVQSEYVENWMNEAISLQTVERIEGEWENMEKFH